MTPAALGSQLGRCLGGGVGGWSGGRTWSRWRRTRSSRARAGAGGAPPAAPSSGWAAAGGSPPAARRRRRRRPLGPAPPPHWDPFPPSLPTPRRPPVSPPRSPLRGLPSAARRPRPVTPRAQQRAGPTLLSVSFLSLGRSRRSGSAPPALPSVPVAVPVAVPLPVPSRAAGPAAGPRRSLGLAFSLSSFIPGRGTAPRAPPRAHWPAAPLARLRLKGPRARALGRGLPLRPDYGSRRAPGQPPD